MRSNKKIMLIRSAAMCSPTASGNGGGESVSSSALIPRKAGEYTKMAENRTGRMIEGILTVISKMMGRAEFHRLLRH